MAQLPSDLSPVMRHLDDWQPPHTERNLVKVTGGTVSLMDLGFQLPHDVNNYSFSKYSASNIRDHQLGTNRVALRQPILSKQTAHDNKESTDISRVIVQYMFDTQLSPDRRSVLANYVVQKGINNDSVRDEIYLQLCSQSMGVASRGPGQPAEAVWGLIAACLCCFPPSNALSKYLLKYVSDNGMFGFDTTCQHKLLHCIQQQQAPRSQGLNRIALLRLARAYHPCLLEWKAALSKGSMALNAAFPDGDKLVGHVESWTTAEQFAAHLLSLRQIQDGSNGWTVTLRDEVDWFECAGHDFILDLISEIEVPPSFPCGTAYFLPTTDTVRASTAFNTRQKWPNQPHCADRLRLMPLEVEEFVEPSRGGHPQPLSPVAVPGAAKIRTSASSKAASSPPTDDMYASRDEMMSQNSALNKRHEPTGTEQLSKSSALNSRYNPAGTSSNPTSAVNTVERAAGGQQQSRASTGGGMPVPELSTTSKLNQRYNAIPGGPDAATADRRPRPPPPQRFTPVRTTEPNHDELIETLFGGIADDDTMALGNPRELQGHIRGGGDNPSAMVPAPQFFGGGMSFGSPPLMSPYAQPVVTSMPTSSVMSPSFMSPLQQIYPGVQQPVQPLHPLAPIMTDPSQLYQQQLYQQQMIQQQQQQQLLQQQQQQQLLKQKQQQSAELQAALKAQKVENEVLQTSVQNELLKQQLVELQRRNTVAAATPPVVPPPAAYASPAKKQQPPVKQKPAAVNGFASKPQSRGVTFTSGAAAATAATAASLHNGPDSASSSSSAIQPPPPPPLPGTSATKDAPAPLTLANGDVATAAATAAVVSATTVKKAGKVADARSLDRGSVRQPPKKIGQIRWPPTNPDDELKPKDPPPEIGRIKIEEAKEETEVIRPRKTPEEIQRQINDMITAAKAAEEAGDLSNRSHIRPPSKPWKPPPSDLQTSGVDMKTRQQQLEQQLTAVRRKKLNGDAADSDSRPAAAAAPLAAAAVVAAAVSPPVPPPPPAPVVEPAPAPIRTNQLPPPTAPRTSVVVRAPSVVDIPSPRQLVPVDQPTEQSAPVFDVRSLDNKRTVLHAQATEPFIMYDRVPWSLELRKEVFSPAEKLQSTLLINMIFIQIVVDVANEDCIRIGKDDRLKMVNLLDRNGINVRNAKAGHSAQVKRNIVNEARDMPIYFSRLFAVNGGKQNQRVQMVGVSHSGVRLLQRFKDSYEDVINVLATIRFDEISEVTVPRQSTVVLRTTSGQSHIVYTPRAVQLCGMIEAYRVESNKMRGGAGGGIVGRGGARESLSLNLAGINDEDATVYDDTRFGS